MSILRRHEGQRLAVQWLQRASLLIVLASCVVAAPDAMGHGRTHKAGYTSTFAALEPNVLGVLVNVSGPEDFLRVSNYSGKTVVVFGYQREPYLRFTRAGVFENTASPTAYLNSSRIVPKAATANADPHWKKVARSDSYTWHDHRIVWTAAQPPHEVQAEPHESHLVFNWRIPARADGRPFRITGFLGWTPPPAAVDSRDTSVWLIVAAAAGGALLVAAAVGAGVRRARRRTPEAPV